MSNKKESISRSLGKFTGEIWRALRAPADGKQTHEVKRTVETEERDTPAGKIGRASCRERVCSVV